MENLKQGLFFVISVFLIVPVIIPDNMHLSHVQQLLQYRNTNWGRGGGNCFFSSA